MTDNKNILLAIVLSIVILVGSQLYFDWKYGPVPGEAPADQTAQMSSDQTQAGAQSGAQSGAAAPQTSADATVPSAPGSATPLPSVGDVTADRATVLAESPRIRIESDRLHGSIALRGGVIDDLTLIDYRETIDPESPEIVVLAPKGSNQAYYVQHGWVATQDSTGVTLPSADAVWAADRQTLSPEAPVTLSWTSPEGIVFEKIITLDEDYVFTVDQRVVNTGSGTLGLHTFGLVSRRGTPEVTGFYILHEGLLGVFDGTLEEVDYDDLQDTGSIHQTSQGGWIGITDKYWLAALIPDQQASVSSRFLHTLVNGTVDRYQVDYLSPAQAVQPGGVLETTAHVFAGAKEIDVIDRYEAVLGVDNFDLSIDFGWFYFLTKPIFYGLLWIHDYVGNMGVAIILLTFIIKLAFFPLANKSYRSMSKMKKLQPEMMKLRDRYKDDKMRLNQEMMALYKRDKVNPASGCLPILVQIPVFFALYKVLFVTIEMRHAPFFFVWQDLSNRDPVTLFNGFGLIDWMPPDFMMIGPWALAMGASMYLQQKLNPQPTDPIQAKVFLYMPLLFTVLLAQFPVGLIVYWVCNNILSIAQQWVIMRRMGVSANG